MGKIPLNEIIEMKRIAKEEKAKSIFSEYIGQHLTFQSKSGKRIEGTLEKEYHLYVKVKDAIITGLNYRTTVEWVCLDKQQIGHFHAEPLKIEKLA